MPDNMGLMDWPVFIKIIKECAKNHCRSVKLNWRGEPLIHPLLPDMIKVAKALGILEVQINTNGQMLTNEKIDRLCDSGLDRIIVSVDGITKKTYESIRLGASWDKLLGNLVSLNRMEYRPIIRIQTCEMPQNQDEIKDFRGFWGELADEVCVHQSFDPLQRKNPELKRKKKKNCPQLWQRLVVAWNGDIHPCCVDWNSKGILGNIKENTLSETWNCFRERYLRFAHTHKIASELEPCKNCDNFLVL